MTEPVLHFDESLGQNTRSGTWEQLAVGTYQAIQDALDAGDGAAAADLISVTVEEAAEFRQIYGDWPGEIAGWLAGQGIAAEAIAAERERVAALLLAEHGRAYDLTAEWDSYVALTGDAAAAARAQDVPAARALTGQAHETWRRVHDYCVDEIYGLLDAVNRFCSERVGRWQSVTAMTKKAKKVPFDPKVFLATVNGGRSISKYRMNQKIFSQGNAADAVFYIQKGKVKITVVSEQGKEAVVAVMGPDEFCGEGCLNGQPVRLATATAMTECEIMRLEKATMISVLHEEPAFSEMFVTHLLARTIRVEADLVDQLFNSSEKRLARALLLLANFGKDGRPEPIIAKVSQETLAEMIGTTRSRVSFFMNKFRKLGLIDYNGQIEIHTSLLNVVLHEEPHINS